MPARSSPDARRHIDESPGLTSLRLVKRVLLIINPNSGQRRGPELAEQVQQLFKAENIDLDLRVTERPGHARLIARQIEAVKYDCLAVVGGDGTIHEVVSGLLDRPDSVTIPIGLIPGGTGNDVAQHLEITSPIDAVRKIVRGQIWSFDVGRIEADGQIDYSVTLVGWAGAADINCRAERLRRLGRQRYLLAALWQILFPRRRRAVLLLDDQRVEDEFQLVIACNTIFAGAGMQLAPRASVDDGRMDVVIVRRASRWQMFRFFSRVFSGSHVELPCVEYYQVRSFSILADNSEPLDIDGEIRGTLPVSIRMIPRAVQFYV